MRKKINFILGLGLTLGGANLQAQNVVVAKNPFIVTPVFDSYQVNAVVDVSINKGLKTLCGEYHKILEVYKDMPTESTKKVFISRREGSGEWQDFLETKFKVGFIVDSSALKDLLRGSDKGLLINRANELRQKETLPFSVQVPMSVEVSDLSGSSVSVHSEGTSLSTLAKNFGLDYAGVRIERVGSQFVVNVYGADLACDLSEGKAKLFIATKAVARPEVSAQDTIGQFYFDFGQRLTSEMKAIKSNRKRIASLGFFVGKLLESSGTIEIDQQSMFIGNLMDFLFIDDTLKLSSAWSVDNRHEYFVNVQKMTEAPVKLELNIK